MSVTRQILFLIIPVFFCAICFAQRERIDSLKKLPVAVNDSSQIDWLNELSNAYRFVHIDSARMFAEKAMQKAEKINFIKGIIRSYNILSDVIGMQANDYPGMELNCKKTISLAEKKGYEKELANSWFLLGLSYYYQAKFSLSVEAFETAGNIYAKLNDELNLANMYAFIAWTEEARGYYRKSLENSWKWLSIAKKYNDNRNLDIWANLYRNIGDYKTSMNYYRQAALFVEGTLTMDQLAGYTQSIGEIFFQEEKYDSAKHYYDLALTYMPGKQNFVNARIGEFFMALKNYDSAFIYLYLDLNIAKKSSAFNPAMWILLRLGRAHRETGNNSSALRTGNELLQTAQKTGARQYIRDGHFLLYQIFIQAGKKDSAFNHLQQYILLKDTLDKDLSAQQLFVYRIRSEKEKDQSKIDLLNEEKKLQQQQLYQTAQQKKFLTAGIVAILLIAALVLRTILLKRKNERRRRELAENELLIQQLENEKTKAELQQQATEFEMQALRSQMNPHFIFNCLSSINRFILKNESEIASDYLTKFSRLMRMVLNNSQKMFINLDDELEMLRLYLDLERLRFKNSFDYSISFHYHFDASSVFIPPLLLQPFAENAIWHGLMNKTEPGNLEIAFELENNILICYITDNGVGRKKAETLKSKSAEKQKSMGMQITAGRLALLNENDEQTVFNVEDLVDANGQADGTRVTLKIKYKESVEEYS